MAPGCKRRILSSKGKEGKMREPLIKKGKNMIGEKFTLMQYSVSAILGLIEAQQFVIPEIQRPFVWKRRVMISCSCAISISSYARCMSQ